MLLPPTGAGAAQLAGAWTHQSLTESLVFFFLHVQGLKMGWIQPISVQQTLFHLICAFTQVLFSSSPFQVEVSVVSPPTPGCCHCKTRHIRSLKSLKPDQNTICSLSHLSLIVKGHLYGTDPDTFQFSSALIETCVALSLWSFTIPSVSVCSVCEFLFPIQHTEIWSAGRKKAEYRFLSYFWCSFFIAKL